MSIGKILGLIGIILAMTEFGSDPGFAYYRYMIYYIDLVNESESFHRNGLSARGVRN